MLHLVYLSHTIRRKRKAYITSVMLYSMLLMTCNLLADDYPRNKSIDILSYHFYLHLQDETDRINGIATLSIKIKDKPLTHFSLDLINVNDSLGGKGMNVDSVLVYSDVNHKAVFTHIDDKITIKLQEELAVNTYFKVRIFYGGVPQDGLIISKNKFGNRTFFGDNWPNRARHWLPCIDHPYDKAYCNFDIEAPLHYEVIASGAKIEESFTNSGAKITKWESKAPLATKLMVIGVANFSVQFLPHIENIPVQSWVFPENKSAGFYDYAMASEILSFFNQKIGGFAYAKLANVQSKTRYGGMENAGNIFYYENSVTGKRKIENLIAHEVAHQWFGDAVTEADWNHVWLSEGFATYFTNVYVEHKYGKDSMNRILEKQKLQILDYHQKNPKSSIIDLKVNRLTDLLNTNTYQKGAWVLHMLRQELGNDIFFEGIKEYYKTYKNRNTVTKDFQFIMEDISGKSLEWFFNQWLYTPDLPHASVKWKYNNKTNNIHLQFNQTHNGKPFKYKLTILIENEQKERRFEELTISEKSHNFSIAFKSKPKKITLDPNKALLLYHDK